MASVASFLRRIINALSLDAHRARQAQFLSGFYSIAQFQAVLARECALVHRNGHEIALVVFGAGATPPDKNYWPQLTRTLTNRVRATDLVGWIDDQQIGVALPYTSAPGAWKLADEICRAVSPSPTCTVYTYSSASRQLQAEDKRTGSSPFSDASANLPAPAGSVPFFYLTPAMRPGPEPLLKKTAFFAPALPVWKRAMDIAGAATALILFSPALLLIALLIKIVSPGPILFSQKRVGYCGRSFRLWKFRTMHLQADTRAHQQLVSRLINNEQPMTKLDAQDDPRLIPGAKILRAAGLDELPQLFNIIRGDMSLIGPRPCLLYEAEQYELWQWQRFEAVPGLTGLWQVSGKNRTTFKEMMRLDVAYARQVSFGLDMKILLKTIPALFVQLNDSLSENQHREQDHVETEQSRSRRVRILGTESHS